MKHYIRLLRRIGVTKYNAAAILALSILSASFDAVGLTLIYLGISAFTQTNLSNLLSVNVDIESLDLGTILILLITIYALRYCTLIYHAYKKSQFIFDVETRSGQEIISLFLGQNLLHKKTNEHINYLNAITKESVQLQAFSISVINLIAELCQLTIISLLFIFLTPIEYQLAAAAIGVLAYIYISFSGKILTVIAKRRLHSDKLRSKIAQEIIKIFKDIQIYDEKKEYLEKYIQSDTDRGKSESLSFFIQLLPRIIFEAVISLTIILSLFLQFSGVVNLENSISILAVLMILLAKAAPAIMRISTSFNSLKYNFQSVNEIYEIIDKLTHQGDPYQTFTLLDQAPSSENVVTKISISNLNFSYPDRREPVFTGWNKTLTAGSVYTINGANGVGKSTLLDLIFGLIQPDEGSISFIGPHGKNIARNQISIGYLSQNPSLFEKTFESNITMQRNFRKRQFDHVLGLTNISALLGTRGLSLTEELLNEDRRFSRGEIQRLAFARSNYMEPTVLLLDEPFAAVDASNRSRIIENLRSCEDRIIIIVSHDETTVKLSDEIIHI